MLTVINQFSIGQSTYTVYTCLSPQETLKTLDPELLEEFLRAAKGMEAFCTPSQLRDMEFYTQCVRTQWEVGHKHKVTYCGILVLISVVLIGTDSRLFAFF